VSALVSATKRHPVALRDQLVDWVRQVWERAEEQVRELLRSFQIHCGKPGGLEREAGGDQVNGRRFRSVQFLEVPANDLLCLL
jgi:hypothetical protein